MPKVDLGKVTGEQGPEGPVAQGAMMKETYDPNEKAQDVFAYVDAAKEEAKKYAAPAAHAAQHGVTGSDPVTPASIGAISSTEKGVAGGVASLGDDGKVPSSQLPSLDFVKKSGDTMTGNLFIRKAVPEMDFINTSLTYGRLGYILMGSDKTFNFGNFLDENNKQTLYIQPETAVLKNALMMLRTVNGVTSYYSVLHEGNLSDLGVARIETGSYVGTGTYGQSKPNRLTFDFDPKIIFIGNLVPEDGRWSRGSVLMINTGDGVTYNTWTGSTTGSGLLYYTFSEKTVEWYTRDDEENQLNTSGDTYRYLAIG